MAVPHQGRYCSRPAIYSHDSLFSPGFDSKERRSSERISWSGVQTSLHSRQIQAGYDTPAKDCGLRDQMEAAFIQHAKVRSDRCCIYPTCQSKQLPFCSQARAAAFLHRSSGPLCSGHCDPTPCCAPCIGNQLQLCLHQASMIGLSWDEAEDGSGLHNLSMGASAKNSLAVR